jgi:serine/threonine-protein kinase
MKLWKFILLLMFIFGGGIALVLTVNFLVLPSIIHHNEVVTTPDIRGMTADGARTRLQALRLDVEVSRQRPHPSIPEGMILDQLPPPESKIRGGRIVRVITSSGPPAGAVPQLVGLSLRQAEITLQRENFRLGRVLRVHKPGVTGGVVDLQNPVAGTELYKHATVDLVVAEPAAAELLRMPDLRGQLLFQARQIISDAGFILEPVNYERTSRVPPNTVLTQTPPAGQRIAKGEHIDLVASSR